MVQAGTRRPLFTSVGGVAIIQTLPADEARRVLLNNVAQEIAGHGTMRLHALQKMQERSDQHGWGVNLGDVVQGVHALAVPVRDPRGDAFAAVCLIGTPELYAESRLPELRDALQAVAAVLASDADKFSI